MTPTRLACLCAALVLSAVAILAIDGQRLRPSDVDALPSKPANARVSYGSDPLQFGDLRLPSGAGPFPVAVVIHGGCWLSGFATLQNTSAFADALRDSGVATWNIEYRRLDNPGGGWPGTFTDVGAAVDHVATLAKQYPLDLARVVVTGHSAGAHLALWAAGRARIAAKSPLYTKAPLRVRGAIALGGPGDLRSFTEYAGRICGSPVIERLLGGTPEAFPERYADASPIELLPLGVRQLLIVGEDDGVMPARARNAYVVSAARAGDAAELLVVPGAHFEVIAPASPAWPAVRDKILELLRK